jgi:trk system potassium uptake protein TrkH
VSRSERIAYRAPAKSSARSAAPSLAPPRRESKAGDVFGWAIPVYLLLLSGGFAFLRSPYATIRGNELSIDRAAFTAINAVTLTGFRQTIGLDELRVPGQVAVFMLMTGGTLLSLIIGGQLVTEIVGLPFSNKQIYTSAATGVGVAALFGAAGMGDTVLHGAFQGVSALGNSGLFIGKLPACDDLSAMLILLPLAVAGGLGLVIWLEIVGSLVKRKPLSTHSLISLSMYGAAYILGIFLLRTQLQTDKTLPAALAACSASAITARSAGFPLLPIDTFTRAGQWMLAALMVIGPASGGTGGGLKGTTLFVLFRGTQRSYLSQLTDRPFAIAAAWLAAYALLIFIGFSVLLTCAPQLPADRVLFLTLSAASNVGWSHDPVSLVKSGLAALSATMLLGRMMPMAVLWWMAQSTGRTDLAVG